MKSYGPFVIATFIGFTFGLFLVSNPSQNANTLIHLAGYLSLTVGVILIITRKLPIKGVPGGLLTGFGLGTTLGSFLFPIAPIPLFLYLLSRW